MEPIRILIADDDPGMRTVLRMLIRKSEGYALVGEAENGEQLMELYERLRPEVVLMDVEMPGLTGMECAHRIQDRNSRTVLVFATAHEQYMKSAFEVYAFDYLVKPFRNERALNTLRLIRERLRGANVEERPIQASGGASAGRMMLKHRDGISFVDLNAIMLIQREERATVLYLSDGSRYVTGDSLQDMEERLPADLFFRTHKGYIVNLNFIDSISPYGRWTYIVKLRGTALDALITHDRFEALQQRFS